MQRDKLKSLPLSAGVYFHKDKNGEIIYVGKAAVLKNRVRQYFHNTRQMDEKTRALVAEIADTDWVETDSEIDALFLEAEMVKRYMPRYNILLRDDKSLSFVRIDMKNDWPYVSITRHPLDDGAEYFGPYYNGFALKKALRYLRKIFPYYTKAHSGEHEPDLDAHLGLSPDGMTSDEYKANLRKLISYIKGNRKAIMNELEVEMKNVADNHDFERAALLRNKLNYLRELKKRIMFGDKEFLDISKDEALNDLTELFNLKSIPVRIEGYDISHISGTNVVASMVVFRNGVSDRGQYRKFKMSTDKNDDFKNMKEVIFRRFSNNNLKKWGKPDFVLIDGGKGQLEAAINARDERGQNDIPFVALAKKEEQIIVKDIVINSNKLVKLDGRMTYSGTFTVLDLPKSAHIIKLFQRIRDESHRFAVSYHSTLKLKKQTSSQLEEIPGIGPKTRTKLIRKFGSMRGIKDVSEAEIAAVIGPAKSRLVFAYINGL